MYTNAKYCINSLSGIRSGIQCDINGVNSFVPLDPGNSDYQRIMALIDAGELVIAEPEAN